MRWMRAGDVAHVTCHRVRMGDGVENGRELAGVFVQHDPHFVNRRDRVRRSLGLCALRGGCRSYSIDGATSFAQIRRRAGVASPNRTSEGHTG